MKIELKFQQPKMLHRNENQPHTLIINHIESFDILLNPYPMKYSFTMASFLLKTSFKREISTMGGSYCTVKRTFLAYVRYMLLFKKCKLTIKVSSIHGEAEDHYKTIVNHLLPTPPRCEVTST